MMLTFIGLIMIPFAFGAVLNPGLALKSIQEILKSPGQRILMCMMHFILMLLIFSYLGVIQGELVFSPVPNLILFIIACITGAKGVFHLFFPGFVQKMFQKITEGTAPVVGFLALLIACGLITVDLFF